MQKTNIDNEITTNNCIKNMVEKICLIFTASPDLLYCDIYFITVSAPPYVNE